MEDKEKNDFEKYFVKKPAAASPMKSDSTLPGILIGVLAPLLIMAGYYLIYRSYMTPEGFIRFICFGGTLPARISLCVIINLGLFLLCIYKEKYNSSRGILIATFLYAGLIVYLKFFAPPLGAI